VLREQGVFGTGAGTFGPGSVAAQYYGGAANFGRAAGSTTTNLAAIMGGLRGQLGGNPSLMASAISRLTGLNISQSMAFAMMKPEQLGGLQGLLQKNDIDIAAMNPTGIATMASIAGGSSSVLAEHAAALRGRTGAGALSLDEHRSLDAAEKSGDQEQLRNALIRIASSRDQEQTEGSRTRASINDLNKTLQKLTDVMVEPMITMRNAMVWMAGGGKQTSGQINAQMQKIEEEYAVAPFDQQQHVLDGALARAAPNLLQLELLNSNRRAHGLPEIPLPAETQKKVDGIREEMAQVQARRAAALGAVRRSYAPPGAGAAAAGGGSVSSSSLYPQMAAGLAETDRILNLSPGTAAAQLDAENGFHRAGYNEAGARGIPQVQDGTLRDIERRIGRTLDPNNPDDAIIIQREYMREGLAKADSLGLTGEERQDYALKYYHGGPNKSIWGPKTSAYSEKIRRNRTAYGNPIPAAPAGGGLSQGRIQIDGSFMLVGPNGVPMAAPINITKSVGAPTPSGG